MIPFETKHTNYENFFDPEQYLQLVYGPGPAFGTKTSELSDINREIRFKLSSTPRYLNDALMSMGKELSYLELSVGPYIYNMLCAASKDQIKRIDCTDFCLTNLQYLTKVIDDPNTSKFDWESFIEVCSRGKLDKSSFGLLKRKFGTAQKLDFQSLFDQKLPQSSYDVIVAEYCVAESCRDKDDYSKVLQFINRSLAENGCFLLVELIEQTYWKTISEDGKLNQLFHVSVSYDWLIDAVKKAGFVIEETSCLYFPKQPTEFFDAKGNMSIWATKVSSV